MEIDPHDRTDLTGPWAGFGFQGGHMFTPEGRQLESCDMTWWTLTCNIARGTKSSGIHLAEALRNRRERRLAQVYPVPTVHQACEVRP
ncbi:DUF3653 domain-containing protein [Stenotrophomonas lactitubi]|uniref:DUF3653 domain-containing protein n=1 Tax=Stenotrophomonas lactitubi TaxID=2045214 RepID=UPI00320A276B